MKTLIIQASYPRSASTVLVNALYGLIPSLFDKPVVWHDFRFDYDIDWPAEQDIIVVKCHNVDIDNIIKRYNTMYKLYFICSERGRQFHEKYRHYENVIIFSYNVLNETPDNSLAEIIYNIYEGVGMLMPDIGLDKGLAYRRVTAMNRRYQKIKDEPFSYVDKFFQLHGSHRSRGADIRFALRGWR